jgi:hypothetical protein
MLLIESSNRRGAYTKTRAMLTQITWDCVGIKNKLKQLPLWVTRDSHLTVQIHIESNLASSPKLSINLNGR